MKMFGAAYRSVAGSLVMSISMMSFIPLAQAQEETNPAADKDTLVRQISDNNRSEAVQDVQDLLQRLGVQTQNANQSSHDGVDELTFPTEIQGEKSQASLNLVQTFIRDQATQKIKVLYKAELISTSSVLNRSESVRFWNSHPDKVKLAETAQMIDLGDANTLREIVEISKSNPSAQERLQFVKSIRMQQDMFYDSVLKMLNAENSHQLHGIDRGSFQALYMHTTIGFVLGCMLLTAAATHDETRAPTYLGLGVFVGYLLVSSSFWAPQTKFRSRQSVFDQTVKPDLASLEKSITHLKQAIDAATLSPAQK